MVEKKLPKQKVYILIRVQPGKELDVYEELKEIPNIVTIDLLHGAFDFIVIAEGEKNAINSVIFKVRKIPYVTGTETMLAFGESFPWEDVSGRIDSGRID